MKSFSLKGILNRIVIALGVLIIAGPWCGLITALESAPDYSAAYRSEKVVLFGKNKQP
jgi:hypothetical protein